MNDLKVENPMPFPFELNIGLHECEKGRYEFSAYTILPWWRRLPCFLGWHKNGRIYLSVGEVRRMIWFGCFRCGKADDTVREL